MMVGGDCDNSCENLKNQLKYVKNHIDIRVGLEKKYKDELKLLKRDYNDCNNETSFISRFTCKYNVLISIDAIESVRKINVRQYNEFVEEKKQIEKELKENDC